VTSSAVSHLTRTDAGGLPLSAHKKHFGTARRLDTASSITKVGTDTYAAPEHYPLYDITKGELTPAADVYGLAKTVYYMLCGSSPSAFRQRPISALPSPIMNQLWAGWVLQVLRRATSSSPAERPQSVREFFEELAAASELTVHTSHRRDHESSKYMRDPSRIIIAVTPEPPRNYWLEFKSLCGSAASYLTHRGRLVGRRVRAAWLPGSYSVL
jgi:serine/threonine protein kinase